MLAPANPGIPAHLSVVGEVEADPGGRRGVNRPGIAPAFLPRIGRVAPGVAPAVARQGQTGRRGDIWKVAVRGKVFSWCGRLDFPLELRYFFGDDGKHHIRTRFCPRCSSFSLSSISFPVYTFPSRSLFSRATYHHPTPGSHPCILSSSTPSAGALLSAGGGRDGATVACSHGRGGGGGAWPPFMPLKPPLILLPLPASTPPTAAAAAARLRFLFPPRTCARQESRAFKFP